MAKSNKSLLGGRAVLLDDDGTWSFVNADEAGLIAAFSLEPSPQDIAELGEDDMDFDTLDEELHAAFGDDYCKFDDDDDDESKRYNRNCSCCTDMQGRWKQLHSVDLFGKNTAMFEQPKRGWQYKQFKVREVLVVGVRISLGNLEKSPELLLQHKKKTRHSAERLYAGVTSLPVYFSRKAAMRVAAEHALADSVPGSKMWATIQEDGVEKDYEVFEDGTISEWFRTRKK